MGNGFLVSAYVPTSAAPVLECTDRTADPTLRAIKMVGGYALTSYAAPEGAVVLYRRATDGLPAAWHAKVGNGVVFFCGTPPGFLTATAQADRWMRDLVRRGCAAAGIPCEPATAFIARKGPYVAVRALRKATDLAGRYVDLLDPNLPVTDDPQIPAGKAAFLKDVGGVNVPGLMALSGRPDAVSEGVSATSFVTRGPEGTIGVARLASGLRTVAGVKAWDSWGRPTAVTARASNGTVLLRYTNSAEGVAMKVVWK
jgi:hypothetical protein